MGFMCPECLAGKHGNCDGRAGIDENDKFIRCMCVDSGEAATDNFKHN